MALVTAHGWDVHGAHRAGLATGWIDRGEGAATPSIPPTSAAATSRRSATGCWHCRSSAATMPRRAAAVLPLIAAMFVAGCCCGNRYQPCVEVLDEAQPPAPLAAAGRRRDEHDAAADRHVYLRQADTFFLDVRRLLGEMVATGKDGVVVFGDAKSYEVRVQEAEVALSAESLTGLLNNHVFAYDGAPLARRCASARRATASCRPGGRPALGAPAQEGLRLPVHHHR